MIVTFNESELPHHLRRLKSDGVMPKWVDAVNLIDLDDDEVCSQLILSSHYIRSFTACSLCTHSYAVAVHLFTERISGGTEYHF